MASVKLQAFERQLSVATQNIIGEPRRQALVVYANSLLAETLAEQRARSGIAPAYEQRVDGRLGAPLESLKNGSIVRWDFRYLQEIVAFALAFARERSPVASGAYRNAWFALVDGAQVPLEKIGAAASVTITNDKPYARKIEVGAMTLRVPPGIVEQTRKAVQRRYSNVVSAELRYIRLAGGYVLKGGHRKGRRAGDPLTYPALVIAARV